MSQSREQLARQLAEAVAEALRADLAERERALLVVSGGSTPVPFFEALAAMDLPWSRVDVTLADERWVAEDADDSNARLVRAHLMQGPASAATFVPLTSAAATPEEGVAEVGEEPSTSTSMRTVTGASVSSSAKSRPIAK